MPKGSGEAIMLEKIIWSIPIKTCDETNAYENPHAKTRRHKQQQFFIRQLFNREARPVPLPCSVTFVRIGPKEMDEEDNLRMAFKWIKDQVGACIFPEKAVIYITKAGKIKENKGHADSDPRVKWLYRQEKATRLSIRIEIESLPDPQQLALEHD
jgi:hypothetical protein